MLVPLAYYNDYELATIILEANSIIIEEILKPRE